MDTSDLVKFGFTVICSVGAAGVAIHVFVSKLKVDTALMLRDIKDAIVKIAELSADLKAANVGQMKNDISLLQRENAELKTEFKEYRQRWHRMVSAITPALVKLGIPISQDDEG